VMNLADPAHFEARQVDREKCLREDSGKLRILYHGTLAHRYGLDILLKAFRLVRDEIPEASLRIHGRGDYLGAIRTLMKDLRLEDDIELTTHFLPAAELSKLITSFHLGVVPYRRDIFTDGILPTKLLEYVALGVPAVVARTSVVSYYFDTDSVEFFDPESITDLARHICRLCRDTDRRKQLALNSENFNVTHNWRQQRIAYVDFVQRLARKQ
jgi:glycosyltransferase involved in cell wall biosynthesis